jgi:hypothetical protein
MHKYKYTKLSALKEDGVYNFYGILYDAAFPTLDKSSGQFVCALKLIDQDLNCLTSGDLASTIINVMIKSPKRELLPHFHNIGEIVRIHRGRFVIIYYFNFKIPIGAIYRL